jgi:hypothetical protein
VELFCSPTRVRARNERGGQLTADFFDTHAIRALVRAVSAADANLLGKLSQADACTTNSKLTLGTPNRGVPIRCTVHDILVDTPHMATGQLDTERLRHSSGKDKPC